MEDSSEVAAGGLLGILGTNLVTTIGREIMANLDGDELRLLLRLVRGNLGSHEAWMSAVEVSGLRHPGRARGSGPQVTAFVVGRRQMCDAAGSHPDAISLPYALRHWSLERVLETGPAGYEQAVGAGWQQESLPQLLPVDEATLKIWGPGRRELADGKVIVAGVMDSMAEGTDDSTTLEERMDYGGADDDSPMDRAVAMLDESGGLLWHTTLPPAGCERTDDVNVVVFVDREEERIVAVYEDNIFSPLFDLYCLDRDGTLLAETTVNNVDACSWASANYFEYKDGLLFTASSDDRRIVLTIWDTVGAVGRDRPGGGGGDDGGGGGRKETRWEVVVPVGVRIFYLRGLALHREKEGVYIAEFVMASIPRFEGTVLALHRIRLGNRVAEEVASFKMSGVTYLGGNGDQLHYVDYCLGASSQILALTCSYIHGLAGRPLHSFGQRGRLTDLMEADDEVDGGNAELRG